MVLLNSFVINKEWAIVYSFRDIQIRDFLQCPRSKVSPLSDCVAPGCHSAPQFFSVFLYVSQDVAHKISLSSYENFPSESIFTGPGQIVFAERQCMRCLCLFKFEAKMDGPAKRTITLLTDVIETKFENPRKGLEAFFQNLFLFFR